MYGVKLGGGKRGKQFFIIVCVVDRVRLNGRVTGLDWVMGQG